MKKTTPLGSDKKKFVWESQGTLDPDYMLSVVLAVIQAAGMTPARTFRVDRYPYLGGGGIGYTLYQPLMESYLIADVYEELKTTEILLSTCKPERIDTGQIIAILNDHIGPTKEVKL